MFQSTWHWQVAPCIILIDASELGGNPPRTPMISLEACCDISNAYMHMGLTEYHFELLQWNFSPMDQPPWFSHTNVDLFPSPWNKCGIFSLLTFYPVHISIDTQQLSCMLIFFLTIWLLKSCTVEAAPYSDIYWVSMWPSIKNTDQNRPIKDISTQMLWSVWHKSGNLVFLWSRFLLTWECCITYAQEEQNPTN